MYEDEDYPDDVNELKKRLNEAEKNVQRLAGMGKELLEQTCDLKDELEGARKSADRKLEEAEQARYTLQIKYDQKVSSEIWYAEELNSLKQQLQETQDNLRKTLEAERAQEVAKLTKQIDELKVDLEQAQAKELQTNQKVLELEELLQAKLKQADNQNADHSFDKNEEICKLYEEQEQLNSEITALKAQMIEKRSEVQVLASENDKLRGRMVARDEELEDIRCQFTSINKALEEARMEKLDLKCQLDALRMENSDHNKKGNSIFSELDDRRVDAEKKVISLQVQVKSLQEKYAVEKQQNQKFKRHISQLILEASSGRVDEEYVASLESQLSSARQELKAIMEEHKDQQTIVKPVHESQEMDQPIDQTEDSNYKQYLITLLKQREEEKKTISKDLHLKTIQLLDEKSRCSLLESQLKTLECEKQRLYSKSLKLGLRVEEMQLKYEPDSVKKSGVLTVKRREKIPLDDPDDIKIKETCRNQDNSIRQSRDLSQLDDNSQLPAPSPVFKTEKEPEKAVNLLDCLKKRKTVRISEEVEEHEVEDKEDIDPNTEIETSIRPKGRRITAVKHVKHDHGNNVEDVNGCKNQ